MRRRLDDGSPNNDTAIVVSCPYGHFSRAVGNLPFHILESTY